MKFHILAVGHRMPAWVGTGFEEYAHRMPRETPIVLREIRPGPRGAGAPGPGLIERILKSEGDRVRAVLPPGCVTVALDERGQSFTTQRFAQRITEWLQDGRDIAFVVGGADGLDPDIKRSAQLMLSLSPMTLPHHLVRVVLAEQLYRASSLLQNHPYHRS